jgi:4-hydroxy-2-oxoglutarate aldolase
LGGYSDFILPSAFANAHGAITGLANIAPVCAVPLCFIPGISKYNYQLSVCRLYTLSEEAKRDSSILAEAQRLQGIVAQADYTIASTSIAGTKALLEKLYGYGGVPRKPLPPITSEEVKALWEHPHTQALVRLEAEIRGHV